VEGSISLHEIDSVNGRILYCDGYSDSPKLRPLNLLTLFNYQTWVTLVFLLILCTIASSFTIFDMRSVAKDATTVICIKTIFNRLVKLTVCLLEKDVGNKNSAQAFIGLLVICLGNNYKNYLKIEVVYPRAGDLTELLDLNFNVITRVVVKDIGEGKLTSMKRMNYHLEIDKTKREKYVSETERWFKLMDSEENMINELASVTSKNALLIQAPYYLQVYGLNLVNDINYPLSCHFVKRPFAHEFKEFYFYNTKAEDINCWTGKFLAHGLFVFWKRSHIFILYQRRGSYEKRSKNLRSSSVEALDVQNFIRQVHLIVLYIVVANNENNK
jgi:hypothetical protein